MVLPSVNTFNRALTGCPGAIVLAVFSAVLATGSFTSSAAQEEDSHTSGTTVPELVHRIETVLQSELVYVDPPAFPAIREEIVRKDRQRLVEAFEKYVADSLGADFAEQSTTGKAMRLLRMLDGIPRIGINDFIDEEIVLVEESRRQLTELLERLRRRARQRLEALRGPAQLVLAGELVLSRIAGPQTGEFYATLDPCTHGAVLRILGEPREIVADANSAEASSELMRQPLTSVSFVEAQRLADKLSEAAGIPLRLPSAGQARALHIDELAVWTRTPWAEQSGDDTELLRYGVEMRTVADLGKVMGERALFAHVPFGRHPRLGVVLVGSVAKTRKLWMEQLQERVKK